MGVSIATMIAALVYHGGDRDWRTPAGIGLPAGMLVSWAGAALLGTRGENRMRRAIWYYNKPLAGTSGSPASGCLYVDCALRLRGRWIVQGEAGTPVAKVGSKRGIALFATAPDSNARVSYETVLAARKSEAAGRRLALGIAGAGAAVALAGNGKTTERIGLGLLFAASFLMPGDKVGYKAGHLERAVWLYNRQFPGER
jgi:hypothetical protein